MSKSAYFRHVMLITFLCGFFQKFRDESYKGCIDRERFQGHIGRGYIVMTVMCVSLLFTVQKESFRPTIKVKSSCKRFVCDRRKADQTRKKYP